MVFEDVHWIDPTSRELLDLTVDRVRQLPVLLVAHLPSGIPAALERPPHVTSVGAQPARRARRRGAGANVWPAMPRCRRDRRRDRRAHRRRAAVCRGADQGGAGKRRAGRPGCRGAGDRHRSTALSVPATLHASLMARLDRLGPAAKEVAQIGAAIGREFCLRADASRSRRVPRTRTASRARSAQSTPGCCSAAARRRRHLPVQARAGAGRRLRHIAARAAAHSRHARVAEHFPW